MAFIKWHLINAYYIALLLLYYSRTNYLKLSKKGNDKYLSDVIL